MVKTIKIKKFLKRNLFNHGGLLLITYVLFTPSMLHCYIRSLSVPRTLAQLHFRKNKADHKHSEAPFVQLPAVAARS